MAVLPALVFQSISVGGNHTCGVTTAGTGYCWGTNNFGQLGDGQGSIDRPNPVAVQGSHAFQSISAGDQHTCGVTTAGDAYCWGYGSSGQLGDGSTGSSHSSDIPLLVLGNYRFRGISAGEVHTCGVLTDGQALCWGGNLVGQLGNGEIGQFVGVAIPDAVLGRHVFQSTSAGSGHTCGVLAIGHAYCWGLNHDGQLGGGFTGIDIPLPVRVRTP